MFMSCRSRGNKILHRFARSYFEQRAIDKGSKRGLSFRAEAVDVVVAAWPTSPDPTFPPLPSPQPLDVEHLDAHAVRAAAASRGSPSFVAHPLLLLDPANAGLSVVDPGAAALRVASVAEASSSFPSDASLLERLLDEVSRVLRPACYALAARTGGDAPPSPAVDDGVAALGDWLEHRCPASPADAGNVGSVPVGALAVGCSLAAAGAEAVAAALSSRSSPVAARRASAFLAALPASASASALCPATAQPDVHPALRRHPVLDDAAALAARLPPLPLGDDASRHGVRGTPTAATGSDPRRSILVTSALPYVNNVPHLGNLVGCVLSADVCARFLRSQGHATLFVCGTDEYGTATETKALEEKTTPAAVCDRFHAVHRGVYEWLGCDFDVFGRTPTRRQTRITQGMFRRLGSLGFLREQEDEQLWSPGLNKFLADRYVAGTCPRCFDKDARGDQCDACGAVLNATELLEPKCRFSGTVPSLRPTRHVHLDLPRAEAALSAWHAAVEALSKSDPSKRGWTPNALAITRGWTRDGLRTRCITRDLTWGTPVPRAGFEGKVFYVWFDAPIGYVSLTAGALGGADDVEGDGDTGDVDAPPAGLPRRRRGWDAWWRRGPVSAAAAANPTAPAPAVELHQFMGKDNVPFHSVLFPATLMSMGADAETRSRGDPEAAALAKRLDLPGNDGGNAPWTLPTALSVTEYLTYEGGKFSKSNNVGVFGDAARETGLPADVFRFALCAARPEAADADFSWSDLANRLNGELLANLGNLVHRTCTFLVSRLGGQSPSFTFALSSEGDSAADAKRARCAAAFLGAEAVRAADEWRRALEERRVRDGLRAAMALGRAGNLFLTENAPWDALKKGPDGPARAAAALAPVVGLMAVLAGLLRPFIPTTSDRILVQLGLPAPAEGAAGRGGNRWTRLDSAWCAERLEAASAAGFGALGTGGSSGDETPDVPTGSPALWLASWVPPGLALPVPEPLFRPLPPEETEALRARFSGEALAEAAAPGAAGAPPAAVAAVAAAKPGKVGKAAASLQPKAEGRAEGKAEGRGGGVKTASKKQRAALTPEEDAARRAEVQAAKKAEKEAAKARKAAERAAAEAADGLSTAAAAPAGATGATTDMGVGGANNGGGGRSRGPPRARAGPGDDAAALAADDAAPAPVRTAAAAVVAAQDEVKSLKAAWTGEGSANKAPAVVEAVGRLQAAKAALAAARE